MIKLRRCFFITMVIILMIVMSTKTGETATLEVGPSGYPYTSIQAAINDAVSGVDEVLVHDGTYYENINFNGKAITVRSTSGPAVTTIDGNQAGSVVTFSPDIGVPPVLDGFTIKNGWANTFGGGIYCNSSSPTITNCVIIDNNVIEGAGGGIYIVSSSASISNCIISGNRVGGISPACGGGGIYCESSTLLVTNSIITGNFVEMGGGGVYCESSTLSVTNCTFSGNEASYGGGIYIHASATTTVTALNSILWGNNASTGGDIYRDDAGGGSLSTTVSYSDISDIAGGGSLYLDNNIDSDPLFVTPILASDAPTTAGDFYLQSGSSCIDTATSSNAPANDIEGTPRPQDGDGLGSGSTGDGSDYDIGAYEYEYVPCTSGSTIPCYTGPPGTQNIGECSNGTRTCTGGFWGSCEGEVTPTAEVCDELDNNCDGQIDEGLLLNIYFRDADGDGYGNPNDTIQACMAPSGYVSDNTDCDDTNANKNPGLFEACDGLDNNCDGQIDEGFSLNTYFRDADGDGYGDPNDTIQACLAPPGYVSDNTDCNDTASAINPGVTEICDGLDNNCDGQIDEGLLLNTYFRDVDGDGYGDPNDTIQACMAFPGYVSDNTDCDDTDSNINPAANEICSNGADDNCDGQVDEAGCLELTSALIALYHMNGNWIDASGNGYDGTPSGATFDSNAKLGSHAGSYDGAGSYVGVGDMGGFPSQGTIAFWIYPDEVADYRNPFTTNFNSITKSINGIRFEEHTSGNFYVVLGGATNVSVYLYTASFPAAGSWSHVVLVWDKDANSIRGYLNGVELLNTTNLNWPTTLANVQFGRGYNTNLNRSWKGKLDEIAIWGRALDPAEVAVIYNNGAGMEIGDCPPEQQNTYYRDADGDGYGDPNDFIQSCIAIPGYVLDNTDCDDTNANKNPGLSEICDGLDNNCDGQIDEGLSLNTYFRDADGDGYGDPNDSILACSTPPGYVSDNTECDDTDMNINPGANEICSNGADDNCDGQVDEAGCSTLPLTNALIALYHMNNDWSDASGNGYDGVPSGATFDSNAKLGTHAGSFGDFSDYVSAGNLGAFPSQGTIAFWMNPDDVTDYRNPFTTNFSGGSINGIRFEEHASGNFYVVLGGATNATGYLYTTSFSAAGSWSHVVLVWDKDANNIRGYLNGVELLNTTNLDWPTSLADVQIGRGFSVHTFRSWKGKLDELAIWGRALDPAEVAELYNNGAGIEIDYTCPPEQQITFYRDADGDGYGDPNDTIQDCSAPSGYVSDNTDCDDTNANKNPGLPEVCDGLDNDCDGTVDGITQGTTCGVGACAGNTGTETCTAGVWGGDTCDPFAGATAETCNNIDDDCDGTVDGITQGTTCGVGACAGNTGTETCTAGVWGGDTCDPFAGAMAETCDGLDNNCDGTTDEGVTTTFYRDADGDTFGDLNVTTEECTVPSGYVADNTDCDDTNPDINPAACDIKRNGIDEDCDGSDRRGGPDCTGGNPEICDDGIDNDGDGDIDCVDSDCSGDPACGGSPEICDDGIDNDGDGKIDCADKKDCRTFPGC